MERTAGMVILKSNPNEQIMWISGSRPAVPVSFSIVFIYERI